MLSLSTACNNNVPQLKKLWLMSFEDTQQGCNLFFDNMFNSCTPFVAKDDDKIVSALYLLPCTYNNKKSHYLYAAATHSEYRGKGIMGTLIEYSLSQAQKAGDSYSFLLPASSSLYNYYGKFGYKSNCTVLSVQLSYKELSQVAVDSSSQNFDLFSTDKICEIRNKFLSNNSLTFNYNHIKYAIDYNSIYGGKTVTTEHGYAVVTKQNDSDAIISEIICSKESIIPLLSKIFSDFSAKSYTFRLSSESPLVSFFSTIQNKDLNKIVFGMSKQLSITNTDFSNKNIYLGLSMD